MPFTVEEFRDLVRILEQQPEWRAELRGRCCPRSCSHCVRGSPERYYIPDVFVVPMSLVRPHRGRSDVLEVYEAPLPLVVEVWSPSTGDYDVDAKLPEYQRRGDLEMWRVQPYERTLTAWRRQAGGTYSETLYTAGTAQPVALPSVEIDLGSLFD